MACYSLVFVTLVLAVSTNLNSAQAVDFAVTNIAGTTPGGIRFDNDIGADYAKVSMESATNFVWFQFQQSDDFSKTRGFTNVFLYVEDDPQHNGQFAYVYFNQIHISASFIQSISGDLLSEFNGLLYHEMARVWQWSGPRTPEGLLTGIADFVRLRAGYIPTNWVLPGQGDRWDQGYDVTARFLDYCDYTKSGFVAEMNEKLKYGYSEDYFVELLGKTVDQVWSDYKIQSGN